MSVKNHCPFKLFSEKWLHISPLWKRPPKMSKTKSPNIFVHFSIISNKRPFPIETAIFFQEGIKWACSHSRLDLPRVRSACNSTWTSCALLEYKNGMGANCTVGLRWAALILERLAVIIVGAEYGSWTRSCKTKHFEFRLLHSFPSEHSDVNLKRSLRN